RRIAVAFDGPGDHELARLLPHLRKGDESALGREARLLGHFTARGHERIFVLADLALGNGPRAGIPPCPEGAPGMHEEHLEVAAALAIEQKPGAALGAPGHAAILVAA